MWRDKKHRDSHIIWGSTLAYKARTPAWASHDDGFLRDKIKRLTEKLRNFEFSVKEDKDKILGLDMELVIKESQIIELEAKLRESNDKYALASKVLEARKKAIGTLEDKLSFQSAASGGESEILSGEFQFETASVSLITENRSDSDYNILLDDILIFSEIAKIAEPILTEAEYNEFEFHSLLEIEVDSQKPASAPQVITQLAIKTQADQSGLSENSDKPKRDKRQTKKSARQQQVSQQTRTILDNAVEKAIVSLKQTRRKPAALIS